MHTWYVCVRVCVRQECEPKQEWARASSRNHKYCIALFDGCVTHFHVSSTNSTVIFSLLSVIFQAAHPDNYPRETPDQNLLILSAAAVPSHTHTHTHTHTLVLQRCLMHSLYLIPALHIAPLISSNAEITLQSACVIYISHIFVMSVCGCKAQLLKFCCRLIVVRLSFFSLSLLYCNKAANSCFQWGIWQLAWKE